MIVYIGVYSQHSLYIHSVHGQILANIPSDEDLQVGASVHVPIKENKVHMHASVSLYMHTPVSLQFT